MQSDRQRMISIRLKEVFEEAQAVILTEVISEAYEDLSDFNELKAIVKELAQAQKRTEEALCKLTKEHTKTREQVSEFSMIVGYRLELEDEAFKALPGLLKRDFGIITKGKIHRRYIKDSKGRFIEVNILGEATQNDKEIMIIGEGKLQLSKKDVDAFIRKKLNRLKGVYEEIFPVLVTYMTTAYDVEEYAKNKGITIYYSYDFL